MATTARADELRGSDAPVRALLELIAAPAALAVPDLAPIGAALADLASDLDYLRRWIERLGDRAGNLRVHAPERGPRLLLVHRPEGEMSPIHDHRVWVAVATVSGLESHRRYRRPLAGVDDQLEVLEASELGPGAAATLLPPDDVHDHGHRLGAGRPAYALVLTGDDQTRFPRNEWDLATGRHRVLSPGDPGRWLASEPWPDA